MELQSQNFPAIVSPIEICLVASRIIPDSQQQYNNKLLLVNDQWSSNVSLMCLTFRDILCGSFCRLSGLDAVRLRPGRRVRPQQCYVLRAHQSGSLPLSPLRSQYPPQAGARSSPRHGLPGAAADAAPRPSRRRRVGRPAFAGAGERMAARARRRVQGAAAGPAARAGGCARVSDGEHRRCVGYHAGDRQCVLAAYADVGRTFGRAPARPDWRAVALAAGGDASRAVSAARGGVCGWWE